MALEFSDKGEDKFKEIVGRYPDNHAALLPVLLLAQSEFGWVSVEVMDYVATRLELNPAKVLSTATFYSMYNKQPVGKCHIQVCTTLSCALNRGYELLELFEDRLEINVGETTHDYGYTLSEVECLAACGAAPMFQVTWSDGEIEYFEDIDPDKIDGVIEKLDARLSDLPDTRRMH